MAGCAGQECNINSDCGGSRYCELGRCRQDCREDFDCADGERCSVIGQCEVPEVDAGVDAGPMDAGPGPDPVDAGPPDAGRPDAGPVDGGPVDAGPPDAGPPDAGPLDAGPPDAGPPDAGPPDAGPPDAGPPDAGPPDAGPTGAYLDRCNVVGDCASGLCLSDRGDTRFCSRPCASETQCASDHVCVSGRCEPDDVGALCDEPTDCALALCAGNPATGAGECTRTCSSARDCPAGFACSDAGGTFVCVDIERPCTQCGTGLCLTGTGCTATCRTSLDCPTTLAGLAYQCVNMSGTPVCVPSAAVIGDDPKGATCRFSGPANLCRSGICIDDELGRSVCSQVCTEDGGCGDGSACIPADDGEGGIINLCQDLGATLDLSEPCTTNAQCFSGLCHASLRICSRLCTDDGLCPTGLTCRPDALGGGAFSACGP